MRGGIIGLCFLSLSGCVWTDYKEPDGTTVQTFNKDVYECAVQAGQASSPLWIAHLQELQDRCMELRGYKPR